MLTLNVYNSRDNTQSILLKTEGSAADLSSVTRMLLVEERSKFTTIDSNSSPDAFDWDTGVQGKVVLSLGDEGIETGRYHVRLVIYSPTYPSGFVWGEFDIVFQ